MSASYFFDKTQQPTDEDLKGALGKKYSLWSSIFDYLKLNHGAVNVEWKHYGKKTGWLAKNLIKKRNIFFLIPLEGGFRLSFTFGDKAVEQINKSDLPVSIIQSINDSRKYAEGRVIQIPVNHTSDCRIIEQLIDIKCSG